MPRDPYGRKRTTTPTPKPANKSIMATVLPVGEKVRRVRRRLKMPQAVLGAAVSVAYRLSQRQVSAIERGETVPDEALLALLAEALGVDIDYFANTSVVWYCTICGEAPWCYWVPGDNEAYCASCFAKRKGK